MVAGPRVGSAFFLACCASSSSSSAIHPPSRTPPPPPPQPPLPQPPPCYACTADTHMATLLLLTLLLLLPPFLHFVSADTDPSDYAVLAQLLRNVGGPSALPSWTGTDPCGSNWDYIQCDGSSVTAIQLKNTNLHGVLPASLNRMSNLQNIGLQGNNFTGPLPSLSGLSRLQTAYLDYQSFTSIPADFFHDLPSLTLISLDYSALNVSEGGWRLPPEVADLTALVTLSLTSVHLTGDIPGFLAQLPNLQNLRLAYNRLSGSIPASFAGAPKLVSLQLNNQVGSAALNGSIAAVGEIQTLSQLWLQVNSFSGPIPDGLGALPTLKDCRLNDNLLVGPIPSTFSTSTSLQVFSVRHNRLDGALPKIPSLNVENYTTDGNGFCTDVIGGACSPEVDALIAFLGGFGYPSDLAASWSGDDPCSWVGISCDASTGKVVTINLPNRGLSGIISPSLANLTSLQNLILNDNSISGTIPMSLSSLTSLRRLWLQNNNISAPVPPLPHVSVNLTGNPSFDRTAAAGSPSSSSTSAAPPSLPSDRLPAPAPSSPTTITDGFSTGQSSPMPTQQIVGSGGDQRQSRLSDSTGKTSPTVFLVGVIVGVVCIAFLAGMLAVILMKKRKKYTQVRSPVDAVAVSQSEGGDDGASWPKFGSRSTSTVDVSEALTECLVGGRRETVEAGNLLISIQVLRNVTQNFSERNVVGKGGFGVVYKGELDDGTKIAVKRMEWPTAVNDRGSGKGLKEFQSEIAVLTKVRHRNLVSLLGYCMDGGERMLVYEYMTLGPLSRHLFEHQKLALPPLSWKRRLVVALDVARGVEYLHRLAHPASFIHRDLKSSNILLSDDYRAKVSDFGLVKLVNEDKSSVETRLAGTFGYLAPEYAVTGRVTTKSDVFSFGVVLMELITGRRAIDETQPEESVHLVAWFRRMNTKWGDDIVGAMDPALVAEGATEETTAKSVRVVAELAGHCTAREAWQRPDMSHAVSVLLPLVEQWKPTEVAGRGEEEEEEEDGIDLDMTLPQALKKWQAFQSYTGGASGSSSSALFSQHSSSSDADSSNGSMPCRPAGFARSFTSDDGR